MSNCVIRKKKMYLKYGKFFLPSGFGVVMGLRQMSTERTLYLTAHHRAFVKEVFQCAGFPTAKTIFQLHAVKEAFRTEKITLMVNVYVF